MEGENKLIVFENKKIRRVWYEGDWWFSVVDVVGVLTESLNIKDYIRKMRIRDGKLGKKINRKHNFCLKHYMKK